MNVNHHPITEAPDNTVAAIMATIRRVGQPAAVAIEACCGAADLAEKLHQKAGWSVKREMGWSGDGYSPGPGFSTT